MAGSEWVITVRPAPAGSSLAISRVVVPESSATAVPGSTCSTAAAAIARLASAAWAERSAKGGAVASAAVAPPRTALIRPSLASLRRSRRIVLGETPRWVTRSAAATYPSSSMRRRIASRRCGAEV